VPRAGLSPGAVVEAALRIVDERGPDALTLAAVAERTGVAAPSLYKHVGSLADLRTQLANQLLDELAERLAAEVLGRSGDDAVMALMHAYRRYVQDHPNRYAALPPDPLHDPALATAANKLLGVIFAVLRAYRLRDSDAVHAIRCLRATVHGFASIEAVGGFGLAEDVDETYERLIRMVLDMLSHY
jgi:AcrR family transcriptional regulator